MIFSFGVGVMAAEPQIDSEVDLRLIETVPDSFVLDEDGETLQWGPVLDSRLRLGMMVGDDHGRAAVQADVFTGSLVGPAWNLSSLDERGRHIAGTLQQEGGLEGLRARTLSVGMRQRWFDVEVGLQTSHWGLGLVANDGASDPLFGRTDFGDRVLRVRFATMPGGQDVPLYLILAGDLVMADELARFSEGDRALQAIAAALYRTEDTEAGLYVVRRHQHEIEPPNALRPTRVSVLDGYVRQTVQGESLELELAAEGALIVGNTALSRTYQAPDGVRVRSGGLAARAVLSGTGWKLHQRLALASGDRSPDDGLVTDFRFDRDHDVGFVLFEEVQSAIDLKTVALVSDPGVSAVPPDGVEALAAEGAFHQALAVQDALEIHPFGFLTARVGGLLAWSTAPIAHPLHTFRNGGVPLNHVGEPPGGRFLGSELDWAIGAVGSKGEEPARGPGLRLVPSLWLQVGHAWPSVSYSGQIGRVDHLLLVFRVRYGT